MGSIGSHRPQPTPSTSSCRCHTCCASGPSASSAPSAMHPLHPILCTPCPAGLPRTPDTCPQSPCSLRTGARSWFGTTARAVPPARPHCNLTAWLAITSPTPHRHYPHCPHHPACTAYAPPKTPAPPTRHAPPTPPCLHRLHRPHTTTQPPGPLFEPLDSVDRRRRTKSNAAAPATKAYVHYARTVADEVLSGSTQNSVLTHHAPLATSLLTTYN